MSALTAKLWNAGSWEEGAEEKPGEQVLILRRAGFTFFRGLLGRIPWDTMGRKGIFDLAGWYSRITPASRKKGRSNRRIT